MVLFEGDWELKRALMCLLGAKMYTTFRSARICALWGERVKGKGLNLRAESPRIKLYRVAPPPPLGTVVSDQ